MSAILERERERAALARLGDDYNRMRGPVTRIAQSRAGGKIPASELDVYYNAAFNATWRKLAAGEIDDPTSYLAQAVLNEWRMELRRDRRIDRGVTEDDLAAMPIAQAGVEDAVEHAALLRMARELEGLFSGRERVAAHARLAWGMDYKEIAAATGWSERASRKLVESVGRTLGGALTALHASGSSCDQWRSTITAYAVGLLDEDGERIGLARAHLDECAACRGEVRRLRGAAAILPPPIVPLGLLGGFTALLAKITGGAAAGAHGSGGAGGAGWGGATQAVAAVAATAVVAGGTYAVVTHDPAPDRPRTTTAAVRSAAPAPAPQPAVTTPAPKPAKHRKHHKRHRSAPAPAPPAAAPAAAPPAAPPRATPSTLTFDAID